MGKKAIDILQIDVQKLIDMLNAALSEDGWPITNTGSVPGLWKGPCAVKSSPSCSSMHPGAESCRAGG